MRAQGARYPAHWLPAIHGIHVSGPTKKRTCHILPYATAVSAQYRPPGARRLLFGMGPGHPLKYRFETGQHLIGERLEVAKSAMGQRGICEKGGPTAKS
jgi:hypothetical protein